MLTNSGSVCANAQLDTPLVGAFESSWSEIDLDRWRWSTLVKRNSEESNRDGIRVLERGSTYGYIRRNFPLVITLYYANFLWY